LLPACCRFLARALLARFSGGVCGRNASDHWRLSVHLPTACLAALILLVAAARPAAAADLTAAELRWLQAAWPVLVWARDQGMPLDVVVQPQAEADSPPLGMAWIDGRCKLVLSMRGNAHVQATEERIPAPLLAAAIELMTAHELGHCQRYIIGGWFRAPAGFEDREPKALPAQLRPAYDDMRATRREEAYADLVGLAWAQRHHAARYGELHGWLLAERQLERVPGSHHDTVAWLRRVAVPQALAGGSMFEAADAAWRRGLEAGD
jgi:hypothetical protein